MYLLDEKSLAAEHLMQKVLDPENIDDVKRALSPEEAKQVEDGLGNLYKFSPSRCTGHYALNFSRKSDKKLFERF